MNWIHNKKIDIDSVNKRLEKCLKSNQFTNSGVNVKDLESFIKKKFKIDDSKIVVCVANATLGLWCLADTIQYTKNEKIQWCTQSFTFPSSCQGILKDTVIVDIDNEGGLDLDQVPEYCNGIIVTNVFGNVVNINKYCNWCKVNNKYLIFDNAATPYTFYNGSNSCNYGIGSVISFHHTKPFGFGEGGAIIVDKEYEFNIRRSINFGLDYDRLLKWNIYSGNYKMSEISAIYILQYLEQYFDNIIVHHTNIYRLYKNKYNMYPNFADDNEYIVLSCLCLLDNKYNIDYVKECNENSIMCRKYYNPLINSKIATEFYNKIICYPLNLDIKEIILYAFDNNN